MNSFDQRRLQVQAFWHGLLGRGLWRSLRQCLALLLVGSLLVGLVPVHAWDANTILAVAQRKSPQALENVRLLLPVIAAAAKQDEISRVQTLNEFFNRRIAYAEDIDVWGQQDYWTSPMELLDKGRGDCEDYAIAKYFSLMAAGVPAAKLRLIYVRAQIGGASGVQIAHMVLAYYAQPDADPLIMDILISEVRPASRRPDLTPVFSFNSEGLWQGASGPAAGDPTARLSRWRDVLSKARAEGFL